MDGQGKDKLHAIKKTLMFQSIDMHLMGDKMEKLGTALFANYSSALMRFPTSLVRVTDRDDSGGIWFSLKKKYEDMSGFERAFPGELYFYNRQFNYRMEVEGWASIVRVEEEVLIRFQVEEVRCVYYKGRRLLLSMLGLEV